MEITPISPTLKGPEINFTGEVFFDVLARGEHIRVNLVRFSPGARTAWHRHVRGQTLHVTEGVGLVQSHGGEVTQIRAGDTIYTPPGEWHWHGAAPLHAMTHLAMWEAAPESDDPETEWGAQVTDEDYAPE